MTIVLVTHMEHCWNDADRGNRSTWRKPCFSAISYNTNPIRTRLGLNSELRAGRPMT